MTFGGHKLSSTAVRYQNQLARMPKSTSCSQTVLNGRQTSEPISKNAQIAVRVHKRSSTSDTCQNQLARMPKQHYCSQSSQQSESIGQNAQIALTNGKVARVHTGGLTWSWSSSSHPKCKFPFHQEKHKLAVSAEQGRNREDPQIKWLWQLLGMSPKSPTWVQLDTNCRLIHHHGHSSPLENPGQPGAMKSWHPAVASGSQQQPAPRWVPKSVTKRVCVGDQLLISQKSINSPGWWTEKFALFQMPATGGSGGGYVSKGQLSLTKSNWWGKSFYRQKKGAPCRNNTVSSDSHLQIGHWWSDQRHLGCFTYR